MDQIGHALFGGDAGDTGGAISLNRVKGVLAGPVQDAHAIHHGISTLHHGADRGIVADVAGHGFDLTDRSIGFDEKRLVRAADGDADAPALFGHAAGDAVLVEVARRLGGALRPDDLLARIGGEEFLIALPGVNLEQAITVIDRIRSDFAALPHAHPGGALHATFSAGVASFPMFDAAAALTEAADAALLHAKRLGRNRVEAPVLSSHLHSVA